MTGSLTVRENLMFSAALRLPSSTTWAQRKDRVENVIQELGLTGCANQKVRCSSLSLGLREVLVQGLGYSLPCTMQSIKVHTN